jgi:AcrR family transcriptional regulator
LNDAKTRILKATEKLIMKHGWPKVTFRIITREAKVNLAAINYHFGSKEALKNALILTKVGIIQENRLQKLETAEEEADGKPLELDTIIRSFIGPLFEVISKFPNFGPLLGNSITTSLQRDGMAIQIREKMNPMILRFIQALSRIFPDASHEKIRNRFFLLWSLTMVFIHSRTFEEIAGLLGVTSSKEEILEEMIQFIVAGFKNLDQESI